LRLSTRARQKGAYASRTGEAGQSAAGLDDPEYHTHDRDNQDYGYHHERSQPHTSPCRRIYEGESEKGRVIAGTTAAGATMGGLIGSATGDTTSGAVLGGVVGGLIGANADTNKVNRKTILGDC
jgi:L-aminopeptidase/D-esterase-like protein